MRQATLNQHVGDRLYSLRICRRVSREKLAPYLSVSLATYSEFESGVRAIPAATLVDLSLYFEVPISHFFEGYIDGEQRSVALMSGSMDLRVSRRGVRHQRLRSK